MDGPFLIGIDVGTTSVKAALFDARGNLGARWSAPIETMRPGPDRAEQNPDGWVKATLAGLAAILGDRDAAAVAGVGVCSQVNTHIFVDAAGKALTPAILWQDGRCAEDAAELDARVPEADRLRWWGAPLPIDASHPLARMRWLARTSPEVWRRTGWVMAPKDYCLLALTGEASADPLSSFGIVDSSLAYVEALIGLVPGAKDRLPPLLQPRATVGRIRADLPGAGAPVVCATMDAWAGMLGAGAAVNGVGVYLSGTSEVGGIVSDARVPTPGVIAFPPCEGITIHAGPTQAGGASVAWLARLLDREPALIEEIAARSDPKRATPIFLPHLQGERAPIWDIAARGAFAGLDASMGAPELARAVLEGVAYSARWLFEALEASAAMRPGSFRHAGGGARSSLWCQIRADVLGRPIERLAVVDAGLLGATMFAGLGTGVFASPAEAAGEMARVERVFEPNRGETARHDESFARYVELYRRLKGFRSFGNRTGSPSDFRPAAIRGEALSATVLNDRR
jgi:xylulokinase